jgi:hypothetical protein
MAYCAQLQLLVITCYRATESTAPCGGLLKVSLHDIAHPQHVWIHHALIRFVQQFLYSHSNTRFSLSHSFSYFFTLSNTYAYSTLVFDVVM